MESDYTPMSVSYMKRRIFDYLKNYSSDPNKIDELIISSYLLLNNIEIRNNLFLKDLIIPEKNNLAFDSLREFSSFFIEAEIILDFETLIELFEFVVSPSEKVINGSIYTPENIRNFIIEKSFNEYNGDLNEIKVADISCGCGGFLLSLSQKIYLLTDKSYKSIYRENIYGIDIAIYSIKRTKILLTLLAIISGEDEEEFQFNLYTDNSLNFNWKEACSEINSLGGFDLIVGNPPYVCSRNMDEESIRLLKKWEVAKTGHPDLYIPFFQIGLVNLNRSGVLGYITVNTFIKSINGRALREYFAKNDVNLSIISFGGEQVFRDRNTYTCICFLKPSNGGVRFIRTTTSVLPTLNLENLNNFRYENLNHHDGWNLVNNIGLVNFINTIENTGIPFKNLYDTKNGIATLKNEVYKFRPRNSDEEFHYLDDDGVVFPIERDICKKIINANKLKVEADINRLAEQIIYPYDHQTKIIPEHVIRNIYPQAYAYLKKKETVLANRDKGAGNYEAWYAYGRKQSMDIHAFKLFFPHISERPKFVICEEMDLLFYNGIAIISDNLQKLKIIKKLLESNLFYKYICNSTKDYASGYISMSRNYIKNFGVFQLDEFQKETLLTIENSDQYLEELYGVIDFMNIN